MLTRLTVDQVKEIAQLAEEAREAQDRLLNKMTIADKAGDQAELLDRTAGALDTLDASLNNPPLTLLKERIATLPESGRRELLALLWVGRGDHAAGDWVDALDRADASSDESDADYIAEKAALHDYLMKGLYELKLL